MTNKTPDASRAQPNFAESADEPQAALTDVDSRVIYAKTSVEALARSAKYWRERASVAPPGADLPSVTIEEASGAGGEGFSQNRESAPGADLRAALEKEIAELREIAKERKRHHSSQWIWGEGAIYDKCADRLERLAALLDAPKEPK